MKKHVLIFVSTLLFVLLFYKQSLGLNLSLFVIVLLGMDYASKPNLLKNKRANLLALCVLLSCFTHAWLFTFTTFMSVILSLFIFRYYTIDPKLRLIIQAIVFCTNWFAFVVQFFQIDDWYQYDKSSNQKIFSKILSYIILPLLITSVFVSIYISSSDILKSWYNEFEINVDAVIILVAILGFYLSFVIWNVKIYQPFKVLSKSLRHNFNKGEKVSLRPTFEFSTLDFEKRSGVITLLCLNAILLMFIVIFNIEHFGSMPQNSSDYSARIHEQINSIIGSIFLAMLVILFYFKGALNFIQNNKILQTLSKIWIVLNAVLIFSAIIQNTLYVDALGLTYKRLGVYLFLVLCSFGLFYTYYKVQHKKTNFYLFDKMSWTVYYLLIFCSLFNWGSIITKYNLTKENVDLTYLNHQVTGNEKALLHYYQSINDKESTMEIRKNLEYQKNKKFLSSELYYQTIPDKN